MLTNSQWTLTITEACSVNECVASEFLEGSLLDYERGAALDGIIGSDSREISPM